VLCRGGDKKKFLRKAGKLWQFMKVYGLFYETNGLSLLVPAEIHQLVNPLRAFKEEERAIKL